MSWCVTIQHSMMYIGMFCISYVALVDFVTETYDIIRIIVQVWGSTCCVYIFVQMYAESVST